MSQNWYFKNIDRNEYVHGSGNGNFSNTLAYDNPNFIIWVMMEKWSGCNVKCFPEHEMPNNDYNDILEATNKTEEYREEFSKTTSQSQKIDSNIERCVMCRKGIMEIYKDNETNHILHICNYCLFGEDTVTGEVCYYSEFIFDKVTLVCH